MRIQGLLFISWLAVGVVSSYDIKENNVQRRQDSGSTALPTLGASGSQSATVTPTSTNTGTRSSETITNLSSTNTASNNPSSSISTTNSNSTSATSSSTSAISSTTASSPSLASTSASSTNTATPVVTLPLQPHITPALSIGGVVLILTGIVYALIGVKNRWVHVFLSTAYLTSLSITVLIVYVLNPPVSNAIQGAYFVGIFMTGLIFGAGALVFKEVTEGLGCLLGGFCLSMWFLTLKSGGLITNTGGKAIFISVFCVLSWSLSFSHYTRAYGLMASTAFSGATAFVLGIDCFSRGGLKEFWVYIWNLNDNIFPLNTNTYPITRGTRVEIVVIVLACIIGVISQLKLWKVVQDRQRQRDADKTEEVRRREAVETALGRHLERQNDRDRSEWEKQYGDRLHAKRDTILWSDAHTEKRYSRIQETEVEEGRNSSKESLEMRTLGPRKPRSVYVARIKRNSSMPVQAIQEVEENEHQEERQNRLNESLEKLEGSQGSTQVEMVEDTAGLTFKPGFHGEAPSRLSSSGLRDSRTLSGSSSDAHARPHVSENTEQARDSRYLAAPDEATAKKRRSITSLFSRSVKEGDSSPRVSVSQEALVIPEPNLHHSRASSLAATLDYENESLDLPAYDTSDGPADRPPTIVISPTTGADVLSSSMAARRSVADVPPSPPSLSEHSEVDPEELVRPPTVFAETAEEQSRSRMNRASADAASSDALTRGILERMPSQLSHVALSYRTNEWAKHIDGADAPLYEEPHIIQDGDNEAPAHLATETSGREETDKSAPVVEPPPLTQATGYPLSSPPIAAAISSPTEGMKVNPAAFPAPSPLLGSDAPPVTSTATRPGLNATSLAHRGLRSASSPMLDKYPTPQSPIDENTAVDFHGQPVLRSPSSMSVRSASNPGYAHQLGGAYNSLNRSTSFLSQIPEISHQPFQSASQLSNHSPIVASRTDTRLANYDSHQPSRRHDATEAQRREAMLADWRASQQRRPAEQEHAEVHRTQMLMQRQYAKAMQEQESALRRQNEMALDMRMRSRDMQELHREALRKMQAGVNSGMKS